MKKSMAKLIWVDQITSDPKTTADFYSAIFAAEQVPCDEGNGYTSYSLTDPSGEEAFGVVEAAVFPDWPCGWVLYFEVDDLEACVANIEHLGGQILWKSPNQYVFRDPAGAPVVVRAKRQEAR